MSPEKKSQSKSGHTGKTAFRIHVTPDEVERCARSLRMRTRTTVSGLTVGGEFAAVTGTVQALEIGHSQFPQYPIRVTLRAVGNIRRPG